jgi:hypothetical protein
MLHPLAIILLLFVALSAATVRSDVPLLEDVSAESFWFAHVVPARVRGTPLEKCFARLGGGEQVRDLQSSISAHLGIKDVNLKSATLFGSGELGDQAVLVLRGDFTDIDLAETEAGGSSHRGHRIVKGSSWEGGDSYLARYSASVCVAGISRRAAEHAMDLLDGKSASWRGVSFPAEIPSAAAVFAIHVAKLGAVLDFEAEFTRSLHHLWVTAKSRGDEVELSISLDGENPQQLGEIQAQMLLQLATLAGTGSQSEAVQSTLRRLVVENKDGRLKVSLTAPPDAMAELMLSLAPIFTGPPSPRVDDGRD